MTDKEKISLINKKYNSALKKIAEVLTYEQQITELVNTLTEVEVSVMYDPEIRGYSVIVSEFNEKSIPLEDFLELHRTHGFIRKVVLDAAIDSPF